VHDLRFRDETTGLCAHIVFDTIRFGRAVGGVRTFAYASEADAVSDAARLAGAMSLKTAIAGLRAGGAKTAVLLHDRLDRAQAFRRLGQFIEDLAGLYRCAGDLGTTADDLLSMAETTRYVQTRDLADGAARGVVNCMNACARLRGHDSVAGLRVAVQGCGSMGSAVAQRLVASGAEVLVADVDEKQARAVARAIGARVIDAEDVLLANVDVVAPCAIGGVITERIATDMRAWAICGAANNQLAAPEVEQRLAARGVLFVPDFVASCGAVIAGTAMELNGVEPLPLIDALTDTTREILETASAERRTATEIAERVARERLERGFIDFVRR
jgi:leucine dehydrogenase